MEMIDLGKGVKVCASDRSYFKCAVDKKDKMGNPVFVTVRVSGGKIPFPEGVSEMQRTVIRANMAQGPVMKTAEERYLEEAGTGQKASLYRDLVEKDIVTFFDENQGSEEKILLTTDQLSQLVSSRSDDDALGEIAELREQLEYMKNKNAELMGLIADAQNIKGVKHEPGSVDANIGGDAAGSVGQAGAEGDGDTAKAGAVGTGRPRGRKANKAADGGNEGSEER